MARGRITAETVKLLKPGARDEFLWDDKLPGFGLKLTPSGRVVYLVQYRMGGRGHKTKRYTIGNSGALKPQQARDRAEALLGRVREGVDIAGESKERKRISTELAFSPYVKHFGKTTLKTHWPKSWEQAQRCLELHASPHWNDRPLPSIARADVVKVLSRLNNAPATKRYLHSVLSYMFGKAVEDGALAVSPMAGMKPPPQVKERSRTLNDDELRWLWEASGKEADNYCRVIRRLILWGQRRGEVTGLPWAELNRQQAEWDLPAARAKNGTASIIPLTSAAIAELDVIAGGSKWPRKGLVYPSSKGTALSGFSKVKLRLDARMAKQAKESGATIERWTLHDLRRTLATNLQRLGVTYEVIEHLLNHKERVRVGIGKVYQTHAFKAEKLAALEKWERELDRIVTGKAGIVIPLRRPA